MLLDDLRLDIQQSVVCSFNEFTLAIFQDEVLNGRLLRICCPALYKDNCVAEGRRALLSSNKTDADIFEEVNTPINLYYPITSFVHIFFKAIAFVFVTQACLYC
ncbi:unnamed protein product [Ilex paraguariensis]|uniref:Uncharacterized protein n=1 Tax=Ilex paraguariensis TaxID=185542 RepID=A0ABC8SDP1_9AQUA